MAEPARRPQRPLQYRAGSSPVHRAGPGLKWIAATALGALGLLQDRVLPLVALLALVAGAYALAKLSLGALWRDLRWLLLQAMVVVALTVLLRGAQAWEAGVRTALQIVLVFLPMALVLRTTRSDSLLDGLRGWLPERIGFAVGATIRFVPFFARELAELVEMQRLRGARLQPGDLWRPSAWRDWLACVAVPMTVRVIEVAEEAADAATLRGVGAAPSEDPT